MIKISFIAVKRWSKSKRFKFHILGHIHILDLLIYHKNRILLYFMRFITINTILTTTKIVAFHSSRITCTIFFITFCLLTSTKYFWLGLTPTRTHSLFCLQSNTSRTTILFTTGLFFGLKTRTVLLVAV